MMLLLLLIFLAQPPGLPERAAMPAAVQAEAELSAQEILRRAHEAAGGERFVRPGSLRLTGYNIIRPPGGGEVLWDRYAMWRVFGDEKGDAHNASGKVRIEGWREGELALFLAYDGERTTTKDGPMERSAADRMWSSSFGFGAVRHALDEGWQQDRLPDRLIDGEPAYMIELADPSGGHTMFGIRQSDHAIVYVGFETPRGWHERIYSHFFEGEGVSWKQAGRVRLFYNGVKANEAVWTDVAVGEALDPALFSPPAPPQEPTQ